MKAIKCDRCGEYFTDICSGSSLLQCKVEGLMIDATRFDICKECSDSFDEWFNKFKGGLTK